MEDKKLSEIEWEDLTKRDKIRGLIGWTMIVGIGVVTYKLGKRSGTKNVSQ